MAQSFGSDPARYDRARPRYPQAMVDRIAAASPGRDVLDVGSGTGIAARQFQAAGCRVLGVEPDARMAGWALQRGVDAEVAAFEAWDAGGRAFDAVVSGQAWHWVDPATGAAKAAAVLRPGGRLAVFWNVFQPPPEVAAAFCAVHGRVLPGAPLNPWARPALEAYAGIFAKAASGIARAGAFGDPEQWRFGWQRPYTRDEWLAVMMTSGIAGQIPAGTLEELLAGTGAAIDARGGRFTMRYTAVVVTALRSDAP